VTAGSFYDRFYYWRLGLRDAMTSIIWGIGSSKFFSTFVDNGYISVLQKTGLIGLSMYLLLLGKAAFKSFRLYRRFASAFHAAILLSCFLAVFAHSVFEITAEMFWTVRYTGIFAAVIGIIYGLDRNFREAYSYNSTDIEQ
jgi:O-antigen ligase